MAETWAMMMAMNVLGTMRTSPSRRLPTRTSVATDGPPKRPRASQSNVEKVILQSEVHSLTKGQKPVRKYDASQPRVLVAHAADENGADDGEGDEKKKIGDSEEPERPENGVPSPNKGGGGVREHGLRRTSQ